MRNILKKVNRWLLIITVFLVGALIWLCFPPQWEPSKHKIQWSKAAHCKIHIDQWSVSHIQANDDLIGFYCWGYLQAKDRAWQMDLLRRTGLGRMAEVYGMRYIKQDFFFRLLDFKAIAKRWQKRIQSESPHTHQKLAAFALGIQRAFDQINQQSRSQKPYALQQAPQLRPWRPLDSLMILILQSFHQTRRSFITDLRHAHLRMRFDKSAYQYMYRKAKARNSYHTSIIKPGEHTLVPTHPTSKPRPGTAPTQPTSKPRPGTAPTQSTTTPTQTIQPDPLEPFSSFPYLQDLEGLGEGSNSWVVAPKRTQNGFALLANDPHLHARIPSFWHEIHIQTPKRNAMGVAIPGVPFMPMGHNEHVAWGVTNGFTNVADLIPVSLRSGKAVLHPKKTINTTKISPKVHVKIGPFFLPIFWQSFQTTKQGPILPIVWEKKQRLLLRWSTYHSQYPPIVPLIGLLSAKHANAYNTTLARVELPCFNIVFADVYGNIGYRQTGLIPKRKKGQHGLLQPQHKEQTWQGFLSPKQQPQ
ncbi:MAG: penicillin acylase family protein, partial [Myxococcota bacterium]